MFPQTQRSGNSIPGCGERDPWCAGPACNRCSTAAAAAGPPASLDHGGHRHSHGLSTAPGLHIWDTPPILSLLIWAPQAMAPRLLRFHARAASGTVDMDIHSLVHGHCCGLSGSLLKRWPGDWNQNRSSLRSALRTPNQNQNQIGGQHGIRGSAPPDRVWHAPPETGLLGAMVQSELEESLEQLQLQLHGATYSAESSAACESVWPPRPAHSHRAWLY